MRRSSRRTFLKAAGLTLTPTLASTGRARAKGSHGSGWTVVSTPTSNTLHDVTFTAAGPYAVGSNGIMIARDSNGWQQSLQSGPSGDGNNIVAAETTDDGKRLWLAGTSGALGEYDVTTQTLTDRTAPGGSTANFTDIAVTGSAEDANVYVADAAGTVHGSTENGQQGTWSRRTPGSGSAIYGIDFYDEKRGVLVDGSQAVFRTTDGQSWTKIGIKGADHSLYGLDADGQNEIRIVGGALYTRTDSEWAVSNPSEKSLQDVAVGNCGCIHAVGASGTILHRPGHGTPGVRTISKLLGLWSESSPTGQNLKAIALGPPHVAVGAAGTVLER